MRKQLFTAISGMGVCLLAYLFAFGPSVTTVRAKELVVRVPGDFPTIQAAIDAVDTTIVRGPNDVVRIRVAPGVYNEHVLVTKSRISIEGKRPEFKFSSTAGREVLVGGTIIDGAGLAPADDHVGVNPSLATSGVVTDVTFENLGTRNARSNDANFGVDAGGGTAKRITFRHLMVEFRDDNALRFARDGSGNLRLFPQDPDPTGCPNPSGGPLQFDPCSDDSAGFFEAVGVFLFGDVQDSLVEDVVVIGDDPRGNNALEGTDGTKAGFSAGLFDIGGTRNTFRHNRASKVWRGLQFSGSSDGLAEENEVSETRVGITLNGAVRATVSHNSATMSGNDARPLDYPVPCPNDFVSGEDRCHAGGGMWVRSPNTTLDSKIEHNKSVDNQGSALLWGTASPPSMANLILHNEFGGTCDLRIGSPPSCVTSDAAATAADPDPGKTNLFDKNKYR